MESVTVRQVWAHNVDRELDFIHQIVVQYPYVTAHAIFIRFDERPTFSPFNNGLCLLQLGLTFVDKSGNLPIYPDTSERCIFLFNVKLTIPSNDLNADFRQLMVKNGIDVEVNLRNGILPCVLLDQLYCKGIDAVWPMMKVLEDCLPELRLEFLERIRWYSVTLYDVRNVYGALSQFFKGFAGSVDGVFKRLRFRHGRDDSYLAQQALMYLKRGYFLKEIPEGRPNVVYPFSRL